VSDVPGVIRRINGERIVLLGWPRAILMQVAHPLIAAGVFEHSTFRDSAVGPIRRLHGTVKAMLGLSFGSAAEQSDVLAGIRAIHTRVHGTLRERVGLYPAGTRYSAEDPALLLWVHATLTDTTVTLYEAVVGELTTSERDEYCRDSAAVAVALGARSADVPRDWTTMKAYVRMVVESGSLVVGADARVIADALLHSPAVNLSGPFASIARLLTRGLLPHELRGQYGIAWDARQEMRFVRLVGRLRRVRRWMPQPVARWRAADRIRASSTLSQHREIHR
jgi:uncharacterized protein (DUF2236 family)